MDGWASVTDARRWSWLAYSDRCWRQEWRRLLPYRARTSTSTSAVISSVIFFTIMSLPRLFSITGSECSSCCRVTGAGQASAWCCSNVHRAHGVWLAAPPLCRLRMRARVAHLRVDDGTGARMTYDSATAGAARRAPGTRASCGCDKNETGLGIPCGLRRLTVRDRGDSPKKSFDARVVSAGSVPCVKSD